MRVLIAEDHVLYRDVFVRCCQDEGHTVVGTYDMGAATLDGCLAEGPDLLILDLRLKDGPAGHLLEHLELRGALPKVLVISGYIAPYLVYRLDRFGVPTGFLHKMEAEVQSIKAAISMLARGERSLSSVYLETERRLRSDPLSFFKILTDYQQQLLRYIARNAENEEISRALHISSRTIEGHRSRLMHKLGVPNSRGLAAYACENGFDLFPPERNQSVRRKVIPAFVWSGTRVNCA